jgi:hypothetical protein
VSHNPVVRFFLDLAPICGIVYFVIRVVHDFWNLWRR